MTLVPYANPSLRRWFRDFFDDNASIDIKAPTFAPKANVYEDKDAYHIDLELPGLDKKDVRIEMKGGLLTVSGERKHETKKDEGGYVRIESSFGSFERSWDLEDIGVDSDKISAEARNGILKLTLPKKEEVKKKDEVKQIEVR